MKFMARRPTLLACATALALWAAMMAHHAPHGFHQW
jgi:hypothetical protein